MLLFFLLRSVRTKMVFKVDDLKGVLENLSENMYFSKNAWKK